MNLHQGVEELVDLVDRTDHENLSRLEVSLSGVDPDAEDRSLNQNFQSGGRSSFPV